MRPPDEQNVRDLVAEQIAHCEKLLSDAADTAARGEDCELADHYWLRLARGASLLVWAAMQLHRSAQEREKAGAALFASPSAPSASEPPLAPTPRV